MTDTLEAWRQSPAMERLQLATRFGKSFVSVNESFTAGYFVRCIDDVAGYSNAQKAKIEDALRECVASQLRMTGKGMALPTGLATRTAIVMPVYNEGSARVFAASR